MTLCCMPQSLQGHQTPVDSVTFDHNEEVVAAGAASGTIKVFDLDQAKGGQEVGTKVKRPLVSNSLVGVTKAFPSRSHEGHVGAPIQRPLPGAVTVRAPVRIHGYKRQGMHDDPGSGQRVAVIHRFL